MKQGRFSYELGTSRTEFDHVLVAFETGDNTNFSCNCEFYFLGRARGLSDHLEKNANNVGIELDTFIQFNEV